MIEQNLQVNTLVVGVDTLVIGVESLASGVDAILNQIREIKKLQKSQLVRNRKRIRFLTLTICIRA